MQSPPVQRQQSAEHYSAETTKCKAPQRAAVQKQLSAERPSAETTKCKAPQCKRNEVSMPQCCYALCHFGTLQSTATLIPPHATEVGAGGQLAIFALLECSYILTLSYQYYAHNGYIYKYWSEG